MRIAVALVGLPFLTCPATAKVKIVTLNMDILLGGIPYTTRPLYGILRPCTREGRRPVFMPPSSLISLTLEDLTGTLLPSSLPAVVPVRNIFLTKGTQHQHCLILYMLRHKADKKS